MLKMPPPKPPKQVPLKVHRTQKMQKNCEEDNGENEERVNKAMRDADRSILSC